MHGGGGAAEARAWQEPVLVVPVGILPPAECIHASVPEQFQAPQSLL